MLNYWFLTPYLSRLYLLKAYNGYRYLTRISKLVYVGKTYVHNYILYYLALQTFICLFQWSITRIQRYLSRSGIGSLIKIKTILSVKLDTAIFILKKNIEMSWAVSEISLDEHPGPGFLIYIEILFLQIIG